MDPPASLRIVACAIPLFCASFAAKAEHTESATIAPTAEEVIVHGTRRHETVVTIESAELRLLPGAFGDPFRAVDALPGVTPMISGLPFFFMRGSPPGNAGYFFDGVRVPLLYHLGLGPSVLHPALVREVDVYSGRAPAHFGRFAGGIIAAGANEPSLQTHGEAHVRLYDAGGLIETPFAGGRGSVLLSGRYSYTAAIFSLVVPELTLDYRDLQARIAYELTPRDVLSVFAFSSYDLLAEEKNGIKEVLFGAEFYRADLRYDHDFDSAMLRTAITLGFDRGNVSPLAGEQRYVVDRSLAARVEVNGELDSTVRFRAGADVRLDDYETEAPKYGDPDGPRTREFSELFPARRDSAAGVWVELDWEPAPGIDLEPGLRADVYASKAGARLGADPRIAAKLSVHELVRAVATFGIAHQPPSFVVPIPALVPAEDGDGLQRSVHGALGAEVELDADTMASATVFGSAFFAINDAFSVDTGREDPSFVERADGTAFGVELYLKRKLTRRIGGILSYTLSRSVRTVDGSTFVSAFDRTHVASAAVTYDWGSNWRSGARAVFYTGTPEPEIELSSRTPAFFRLDLRVEKRWTFDETAWLAFVFEVQNATFSKETVDSSDDSLGPIVIPNLGVEAGF
jgi:hypothetical protein